MFDLFGGIAKGLVTLRQEQLLLDFLAHEVPVWIGAFAFVLMLLAIFNVGPLKHFPIWADVGLFCLLGFCIVVSVSWLALDHAEAVLHKPTRLEQRQPSGPIQPGFTLPGQKPAGGTGEGGGG